MRAKKHLLVFSFVLAALALSTAGASAEVPNISVTNTGGVPKFGTNKCEFTIQFQKCQLTVSNGSTFPVIIDKTEIAGTNGSTRYGIINVQCKKGSELASGKSCTDEVILNVFAVAGWSNWYAIEVEEKGNLNNRVLANASLTTV